MTSDRKPEAGAEFSHRSVLLDSAVDYLVSDPAGRYIDATFGRGGHSQLVLGRLGASGKLLGIDKDPEAIRVAEELAAGDSRFSYFHGSLDRKSTRLNSSHVRISYAVFCLKKKN